MVSGMSDRAVSIAAWAAQRLQNTGPSYPRSEDSAVKIISPQSGSVISYCEPTNILEIVGRLAVDRKGTLIVPVYSAERDTVDIQNLNHRLWNACSRRAQSRNIFLVHCPKSAMESQIQKGIVSWMKDSSTSFKEWSSEQFIQKLCNVYIETATQSSNGITEEAIKNLCSVKYMTVDDMRGDVGYTFPSEFTSLCIHQVVTKTQEWWEKTFSCKEQPSVDTPFPNFFQKVLASTNSSLSALRQDLKKESNIIVEKERFASAVKSLSKSPYDRYNDRIDLTHWANRRRSQEKPTPKPVSMSPSDVHNASDQLTSSILDDLCKEVFKLSVDDIGYIPDGLTFEGAVVMLKLSNMGKQKPKTVGKLRNALKVSAQFMYFAPLWNVKAIGKNCSPKKPKRNSQTKPKERQIIQLRKKAVRASLSLEPDAFLEELEAKKMDKKAKMANGHKKTRGGVRPGVKRKLPSTSSRESLPTQDRSAEVTDRLSVLNKSLTSRADNIAQKLSTFTVPANEDTKMKAVVKIREVIASCQRPVEAMETNNGCENQIPVGQTKAQLLDGLIKACIQVEKFPKEETIKALKDAGVISLPATGPLKISDHMQDKIQELQEKKDELRKRLESKKEDQKKECEDRYPGISGIQSNEENTSATFQQIGHNSVDKHAHHSIKPRLVSGAIISVVLAIAIYIYKSYFYS